MAFAGIPRQVRRVVFHCLKFAGIDLHLHTEDRRVLEGTILPYFAHRADFTKVLFVGCGWYTTGYRRFFSNTGYWTLDIDPTKSRYGSPQHITDSLTNVGRHFAPGQLDLIICNGVFGWGLDSKPDVERAFKGCYECLRPDGLFLLGWNDIPERRPFPHDDLESLRLFRPFIFPPMNTAHVQTATASKHIYSFYAKRALDVPHAH